CWYSTQVRHWVRLLPKELRRIEECRLSALDVIDETLRRLGVPAAETEEYLTRTLLALRGWAGMIWQMETNAEWAVHPAPPGSLIGYVAVRLLLLRLAIEHVARTYLSESGDLTELRSRVRRRIPQPGRVTEMQRTFLVCQVAQSLGWNPGAQHRRSNGES